ncbi:MAG: hypothetical protein FJ112_11680 [Deltaproteobacteria bacterium]|nr:hypothetical protein [Deltaproteobacteria bacterium]
MAAKTKLLFALCSSLFLFSLKSSCEDSQVRSVKFHNKIKLAKDIKKNKPILSKEDQIISFENQSYRLVRRANQPLSAQNLETGKMGVITGILVVKLKKTADFSAFTRNLGFDINYSAPQIHTLFLKFKNFNHPLLDLAILRENPDVELAEIEVIESKVKTK